MLIDANTKGEFVVEVCAVCVGKKGGSKCDVSMIAHVGCNLDGDS